MLLGNLNLNSILLGSDSPVKATLLKIGVSLTFLDYDDLFPAAVENTPAMMASVYSFH